jgi:4-hydroxy-tetrahydrodipicolinate synthase
MEAHFRAVADEVDLPQVIYNVPSRTGRNIAVETAVNLATHPNIVGYKAASGDMARISEVIERTHEEAFSVLSGDDALNLPIVATGGTGCISVAANVEPERCVALVDAALEGDTDHARELNYELGPLFRTLFVETNPIPVKEAMAMRGHMPRTMRPPLSYLSEEHRERLRSVLAELESEATATA